MKQLHIVSLLSATVINSVAAISVLIRMGRRLPGNMSRVTGNDNSEKSRFFRLFPFAASLLLANSYCTGDVHAEFVKRDLASIGDQLILYDTDTDLEWLSLSATENRSISSLLSGTEGPDYLGEYGFHSRSYFYRIGFPVVM